MAEYVLAINPTTEGAGSHDPSAVIFEDGKLAFGIEEERLIRQKHAQNTFPKRSIQACLDYCDCSLSDVTRVIVSWQLRKTAKYDIRYAFNYPTLSRKGYNALEAVMSYASSIPRLEGLLSDIGTPVPPIEMRNHHQCHAASAFYPSEFDEAVVLTIDGRGENESTVIWKATTGELTRVRSYPTPNSWGMFYSAITEFLGYRSNNGEGKVMGLAPYGQRNDDIETALREYVTTGVEYDVTPLFDDGYYLSLDKLERLFDREPKSTTAEFTKWERDLAHVAQKMLEESVVEMVETYCDELDISQVALAGGVAQNCKMNKCIMELDKVEDVFIQPVAHDAGTALGAGLIEQSASNRWGMTDVYWGPEFSSMEIKAMFDERKIEYFEPDNLPQFVARQIADGKLVGWFQGRMEMGPRALGNRSIIADSRTTDARDQVNAFVKHREEWRPFAPSMLEEAADDYLIDAEPAPYMIKTFDVRDEKRSEIPAVLHEGDQSTRPQTVREEQNPRYYRLIKEFESLTGVPVVLNTSFNDHGEPIVTTPIEALKDFYGMGLDLLAIEDLVIEK